MSQKSNVEPKLSKSGHHKPRQNKPRAKPLSRSHRQLYVHQEEGSSEEKLKVSTSSSANVNEHGDSSNQNYNKDKPKIKTNDNISTEESKYKRSESNDLILSTDSSKKKSSNNSKLKKLFFWKRGKDAKKVKHNSKKQKSTYICDNFEELPEEWKKKIIKLNMDTNFTEKRFKILLNVLHFLTKDSFRMSNQEKKLRDRKPYASQEILDLAQSIIRVSDEKLMKKVYKHVEFSGKGGFGRVFSAKEIATKTRVAIKKLPQTSEKSRINNLSEIGFLARCKNPNIVRLINAWHLPDKEEVWIVTEYLEGGTLAEAVKVHQFSEHHIAYIAREVLKALKYLHSIGFVHRDLKSGNVMMSIEGRIKLIDFGLCCDINEGPRTQMLGSPYWIPPEMIKGQPHSCPADIWSFAVCVLEMFCKEPPNSHSRLYAMYTASTKGLKPFIPDGVSDIAKDFLELCLKIDPKKRASAEELLEHPFVKQPKIEVGIKDILRGIFVSNSLALSGI